MVETNVRAAGTSDIGRLGIVGPAACAETYGSFWDRADAFAEHLATFGSASFADLLARPDADVWVAEANGVVVGFATLIRGAVDPIQRRPGGAELSRLYLLGAAGSLGLGRRLLEAAASRADQDGATHLWLQAMEAADWAVGAYRSWGFREIGRTRFEKPVRPELAGMVVMMRPSA